MHLKGLYRCYYNYCVRSESCFSALNIKEFFSTQVSTEAGLSYNIVAKLKSQFCGCYTVAAVGNIGEGSAVHNGRVMLKGLDKVGLNGVLKKGCHGSLGIELSCRYGFVVPCIAYDYVRKSFLKVCDVL